MTCREDQAQAQTPDNSRYSPRTLRVTEKNGDTHVFIDVEEYLLGKSLFVVVTRSPREAFVYPWDNLISVERWNRRGAFAPISGAHLGPSLSKSKEQASVQRRSSCHHNK